MLMRAAMRHATVSEGEEGWATGGDGGGEPNGNGGGGRGIRT